MIRSGFTVMELMIVIGMLGIIAAVVVAAINPTEQLVEAQDAKRRNQVNAIQKALFQYSIDAGGELPNQGSISTDSANPTNICREGQTGSCVVFDSLIPNYLTALPVDPTETGADLTGFAIYTDTYGRANVVANYLGQTGEGAPGGGGDTTPPTISSITPTDGEIYADPTANLTIVFSESVTKQTGNVTIKNTSDDSTVEAIDVTTSAVTVASDTVTINPSATLAYSSGYYVQIDGTAFDDAAGNSFAGIATATEWDFEMDGDPGRIGANFHFDQGGTTDSFGDIPAGFVNYSNSFNAGDVRFRQLTGTTLLRLGSQTAAGNGSMYNGINDNDALKNGSGNRVTVRYRFDADAIANAARLRFHDGNWSTISASSKVADQWYVQTADLGTATLSRILVALQLTNSSQSGAVDIDYLSISAY